MNSTIDRNPEQGVRAELGHIRSIEGLRGVAVLWVIVFHYVILRNGKFDDPWLALVDRVRPLQVIVGNGYLGVDLFFLITGFLLTLPWFHHAAEGRAAPSALDFYVSSRAPHRPRLLRAARDPLRARGAARARHRILDA